MKNQKNNKNYQNNSQNHSQNSHNSQNDMRSSTDVNGSYTGKPENAREIPVQDADDL